MSLIVAKNIYLDFPIIDPSKSLRAKFAKRAVGGPIRHQNGGRSHLSIGALRDISLQLRHGDRLALFGHNGAGKSTLLRVLAGIYEPTRGEIRIEGRISPLMDLGLGMDLEETGYENIVNSALYLGIAPEKIKDQIPFIEEFTELGEYLSMPVRTYSSGMLLRLSFAIATSIVPEILLIDEIFGVGDAKFAKKAKKHMTKLIKQSSILVLASHSLELTRDFCSTAAILSNGNLISHGPIDEIIEQYKQQFS